RRGGDRSAPCLRDERREAFQVGAARQAADPCEAEQRRDRGVPAVARHGDRAREAPRPGVPRRDGRAGAARARVQGFATARRVRALAAGAARDGHGPPFLDSARAGRADPARRDASLCHGSRGRRARAVPQGDVMSENFKSALLLSMPQLQDPNFARTVVLLCEYNPDGALGLVLTRPTNVAASEMVRLDPPVVAGNDMPLWIGGPVEPQRGWILLGDEPQAEFKCIRDGLYLSTSQALLRE